MSDNSIVKHNLLIESNYQLNSREQFFLLYLVSQIKSWDHEFNEYIMHINDIKAVINFDGTKRVANSKDVFEMIRNLNKAPIRYENEIEETEVYWVSKVKRNKGTDMFTFSFSPELRVYLLQLKEHFTRYNLENLAYLSGHSIRIYEILKRHQYKEWCILEIDQLKFYLGLEGLYSEFYEFKRRVLLPAQYELKQFTDIAFTFEPAAKEGKTILSLTFNIVENSPEFSPPLLLPAPHMIRPKGSVTDDKDVEIDNRPDTSFESMREQLYGQLSKSQLKAFEALVSFGVNTRFALTQIVGTIRESELIGYEDLYILVLLQYFMDKTKIEQQKGKAGVLVKWWKEGYFKQPDVYSRLLEITIKSKKVLGSDARYNREIAKTMTAAGFSKWLKEQGEIKKSNDDGLDDDLEMVAFAQPAKGKRKSNVSSLKDLLKRPNQELPLAPAQETNPFNFEQFKQEYAQQYEQISSSVTDNYQKTFGSSVADWHEKYERALQSSIKQQCEQWWRELG